MSTARDWKRRDFLRTLACAPAIRLARNPRPEATIEVLLDEPIGTVLPDVYGHFIEHLGGVVYDGIWVGEDARVEHVGGIRKALVDHLRAIRAPVVRWPGGCFADSYDWRDGIGPREQRPSRTNFWIDALGPDARGSGPPGYEPNHFGTNEFIRFCHVIGAEPYLAANLRSLPARDFQEWVEYCNAPSGSTTLAARRAASGASEPFNVLFWGVGNESWGCGGNFSPDEYAAEFRRFTAWVPRYGLDLKFIAAGPTSGDLDWTRGFFSSLTARGRHHLGLVYGWGLHHYSWNVSQGRTTDWDEGKGDAVEFGLGEWYELLREADRIDTLIAGHWAAMGEIDREHRVKFAIDEWGAWHRPGTEAHPSHLFGQMSTLRDALVAALTLDTFHRHADKVVMGNVAQTINCLHSLFLAHEDRFVLTPNYHVFEMYAPHQGARALRTVFSAPETTYDRAGQPASLWGLNGSASLRDRTVVLTMVNPHATQPRETGIVVRGAWIRAATGRTLASTDLRAHNTFDAPRALEPRDTAVALDGGGVRHEIPAASVTRLALELT